MPDLLERLKSALGDRYAVDREIGRGGMATVYLAEDVRHDRQVAIKVLLPELSASVGAERFLQEIRTVARLNHPHILPVHDSGDADGLLYYAMPYVEGESLRQLLDRKRQLSIQETVRMGVEIADALDYAHRQGVIHRDIKPGNILLSEGHAVLADFGIARAVSAAREERVTRTGLGVGTPLYSSPEQATADETIDGRTDIYSLGVVLYEMLAGEVPLGGATPQSIQAKRLNQTPTPLTILRDTVPPLLDSVIARALARVPADRFETGKDFGNALMAATMDATSVADLDLSSTPGLMSQARVRPRRRRWAVLAAGLMAASLVVFGAIAGYRALNQTDNAVESPVPTAAQSMESRWLYLEADAEFDAAMSGPGDPGPGWIAAAALFDSATHLDPSNAQAWAGLAKAYALLGAWVLPSDSVFPLVLEPAMRAIQLDSTLAEAHEALALKYWVFDLQWLKAHDEYVTAARLEPNTPGADERLAEAAHILTDLGWRDSAVSTVRRAVESGLHWLPLINYPVSLLHGGDYEAALTETRRVLRADDFDEVVDVVWRRAEIEFMALLELERFDEAWEALAQLERSLELYEEWAVRRWMGLTAYYHARVGDSQQAQAVLEQGDLEPALKATAYAWMGDLDQAFELLEEQFDSGGFVFYLPSDPAFAPLRKDPRFDLLLARMGLSCRYYDDGHECFQR
jgi:tRNA A-37 threonylcarbamoyl transferase component Bud32/tetratricopeptide (TPR) repeat protein